MSFRHNISRVLRAAVRVTVVVVTLALLIAWPVSYWRLGRVWFDRHSVQLFEKEFDSDGEEGKGWYVKTEIDVTLARGGIGVLFIDELCVLGSNRYRGPGSWRWGTDFKPLMEPPFEGFSGFRTSKSERSHFSYEISPYRNDTSAWASLPSPVSPTGTKRWLVVPMWLVLLPLMPWSWWIVRGEAQAFTARRRTAKGLCAKCGYDLRASAGACPECGAAREGV